MTLSKLICGLDHVKLRCLSSAQTVLLGTRVAFTSWPCSSRQLANRPPNRLTPIMLKMSQNTRQTSSTLNIAGIAWINAFTTTCNIVTPPQFTNSCKVRANNNFNWILRQTDRQRELCKATQRTAVTLLQQNRENYFCGKLQWAGYINSTEMTQKVIYKQNNAAKSCNQPFQSRISKCTTYSTRWVNSCEGSLSFIPFYSPCTIYSTQWPKGNKMILIFKYCLNVMIFPIFIKLSGMEQEVFCFRVRYFWTNLSIRLLDCCRLIMTRREGH